MVDKKFSKEQWFNLSQDERDFYTLEFKQAVERRQKLTILSTRILAGFLILFLFFYGFVLLKSGGEYNSYKELYGKDAFCYLCGLESLKKCECQYVSNIDTLNREQILSQQDNLSIMLAEYNVERCKTLTQRDNYEFAGFIYDIDTNIS